MTDWKHYWDYPLPDPSKVPMAEYMMAYDIRSQLANADLNFLGTDPQYASPQAYIANMVRFAISLTQNNFAVKYAPPGWDAVAAGVAAAYSAIDYLKQLPVRQGDPDTPSVYDAWVSKSEASK